MGEEYEYMLERKLRKAGLSYIDEQKLMAQGFAKTPDVLLVVPFAVQGREVNWIDSKAMFGSKDIHVAHLQTQLQPYVNRYGPGLVIYWFGFVAENAEMDPDVIVLEDFPSDIVTLSSGWCSSGPNDVRFYLLSHELKCKYMPLSLWYVDLFQRETRNCRLEYFRVQLFDWYLSNTRSRCSSIDTDLDPH